jgi:GxxExxY protein
LRRQSIKNRESNHDSRRDSEQVIKSFYHVYNTLGYGFLERVYENALRNSLRKAGLDILQQLPVSVYFEDEIVGDYFADLVVANKIIIEVKAAESIAREHESQILNYLKATGFQVGLILNLGPQPSFVRKANTQLRSA